MASLSVCSEVIEASLSPEILRNPITPVTSEALSSLLTLIRQDPSDEPCRRRHQRLVQKLANAAETSLARQALDQDQINLLSNMKNKAKTGRKKKSNIVGRTRVMKWEDIEIARAKRAEQDAATEAKGKQKRGHKPKRSATTMEEPSGTTAEAAEASYVAESSRVSAAGATVGTEKPRTKRKRAKGESREPRARSEKRNRSGDTIIMLSRVSRTQTIRGHNLEGVEATP